MSGAPHGDVPTLREAWRYLLRLASLTRSYWPLLVRDLLIGLALGLVSMITPYLSKMLIDDVYPTGDAQLMHVLVGLMVAVSLSTVMIGALRGYFSQVVTARLQAAAGLMFFNHLLHLPIGFYDRHQVGEVSSRFQDLRGSLGALFRALETVFLRGAYVVLVPPILFWFSWKLALLSLLTIPFTTATVALSGQWLRRQWKDAAEANADLSAYQFEVLSHVRTLKAMGLEGQLYRFTRDRAEGAIGHQLRAGALSTLVNMLNGVIRAMGTGVYTWFGWTLIVTGEITLGTFMAFSAYRGYLTGPMNQLTGFVVGLQRTAVSFARLYEYLDEAPEQEPARAYGRPRPVKRVLLGKVELEGVSFRYDQGPFALEGVDLTIPAGMVVSVVGPSGAGKSSLLQLLCRMRGPSIGRVLFDGLPATSFDLSDVRRQCAVVWQDPALLRGTLLENLTLGREIPRREVDRAVATCQLELLASQLPDGLDSSVGEWGATLSGGQRQRVAIARALLRDTPLLLLDEATSNVDPGTEHKILEAVFSQRGRQTIVYVTHRIQSALLADRVAVFDMGRLVGFDTHDRLLLRCEPYHRLAGEGLRAQPDAVAYGL